MQGLSEKGTVYLLRTNQKFQTIHDDILLLQPLIRGKHLNMKQPFVVPLQCCGYELKYTIRYLAHILDHIDIIAKS